MPKQSDEPSRRGDEPIGTRSAALVLTLAALWGGTPVAVAYSVDTLPPVAVAALRFLLASIFMLIWCRWEKTPLKLTPQQVIPSLLTGILLFVQIGLFHVGVHWSNAAHGTLLINAFVLSVAAIEHFVTKTDRLTLWRMSGLLLAGAGVILILLKTGAAPNDAAEASAIAPTRDQATLAGDVLLVISSVVLGVKIIYTKYALKVVEPGKLIFWHDVIGMLLLAAYSALFETFTVSGLTGPAICGLLYQGVVVAGFCFAAHARLLKRHSASRLSVFSFATPLFGVAIAYLFRGDPLSSWLFVSGLCVAIGILLVNSSGPRVLIVGDRK